MEFNIVLLPKAIIDLEKSIEWYHTINVSLAKQFSTEIEATIKLISRNPLLFQNIHGSYKSVNTSTFPFRIIYRIDHNSIVITAILHHKRNPQRITSRTK